MRLISNWCFVILMICSQLPHYTCRPCELGPSDLLFVIQSSFDIEKYDFEDIKSFIRFFLEGVNIGKGEKDTRVGVILFDKVREPEYHIKLNQLSKLSKLQLAIDAIQRLPCGYWWCKMKPNQGVAQAVELAIKIFGKESSPTRMKKLVVFLNGKQLLPVVRDISSLAFNDPLLRVAQVLIVPDITETDDPYYQYLLGYYQPYERYLGRIHQLYPNVTLPKVQQTYNPNLQLTYSKEIRDGVIILQSYEYICTIRNDLCNILFACPPCQNTSPELARKTNSNPTSETEKTFDSTNPTEEFPNTTPSALTESLEHSKTDIESKDDKKNDIDKNDIDAYDYTELNTVMTIKQNSENSDKESGLNSTSITQNKVLTEVEINKKSQEEDASYVDYTDDDIIEDDSDEEDTLPFGKTVENITENDFHRRHKRQTYQIYPIHLQEYCICPENLPSKKTSETSNDFFDIGTGKIGDEKLFSEELPKNILSIAKGCIQLEAKSSGSLNSSLLENELINFQETRNNAIHSMPLSRKDFEECYRSNITADECLKIRKNFFYQQLNRSCIDTLHSTNNFSSSVQKSDSFVLAIKNSRPKLTESLPKSASKLKPATQADQQFEAGIGKWFGTSNKENLIIYNGVAANPTLEGDRNFSENEHKNKANVSDITVSAIKTSKRSKATTTPEVVFTEKQIVMEATDDNYEEFVAEQSTKVNSKNKITRKDSNTEQLKGTTSSKPSEQSLVSLADPESGVLPKIAPPTILNDDRKILSNLVVKTRDVKTLNGTHSKLNTDAQHKSFSTKRIRPQKKPDRKPLTSKELLSSLTKPQKKQCVVEGVDVIFYIDDSEAMSEYEFYAFRLLLKQFYKLFETNRQRCKRVSRIGIMKNQDDGSLNTYLNLSSPMNILQKADFISKMDYAGCLLTNNEKCRNAIVDAYRLVSILLTAETNDRKKVLVVVTSRPKKHLRSLHFDFRSALEDVQQYGIEIYSIGIGPNYNEKALMAITTTNTTFIPQKMKKSSSYLIKLLCLKLTVSDTDLASKSDYCPWK